MLKRFHPVSGAPVFQGSQNKRSSIIILGGGRSCSVLAGCGQEPADRPRRGGLDGLTQGQRTHHALLNVEDEQIVVVPAPEHISPNNLHKIGLFLANSSLH